MENTTKKRMTVSCPVSGKEGKTYWKSMGIGYQNLDGSINILLDSFPVNGKLYITEWRDFKDSPHYRQRELATALAPPPSTQSDAVNDLPF